MITLECKNGLLGYESGDIEVSVNDDCSIDVKLDVENGYSMCSVAVYRTITKESGIKLYNLLKEKYEGK